MKTFRFIDLFAGVGGFHIAMKALGGECVFASEIDKHAIRTYQDNFEINPAFNIRDIDEKNIPRHDVLCAGFPCQAFSKAGKQEGFEDTRGTLFFEILRILKFHKPKFIILENVRNLVSHDHHRTWRIIAKNLKELGYVITEKPLIVSPHHFGIPQLRERVFILGVYKSKGGINSLKIDVPHSRKHKTDSKLILENDPPDGFEISKYEEFALTAWDEFLKGIDQKVIGFPVWALEFRETYDISFLPKWKQEFITKNRELYSRNRKFLNEWFKKYDNLKGFVPTHTKFEWQAGGDIISLWEGIIQFRPSGIRVKRPTEFPALVAMVHIPIIGWQKRRLTPREVANLQSFPQDYRINRNLQQAYKQFGNAVNVKVVEFLAKELFNNK